MRQMKLQVEYEYDFVLFGLLSSVKGFKLAWSINNTLSIELVSAKDIEMSLRDNRKLSVITYEYNTQNSKFILFQNKLKDESGYDAGYILPEMSKLDFLFRIDGEIYPTSPDDVLDQLKSLSTVEYCMRIDANKLKSKENLLLY